MSRQKINQQRLKIRKQLEQLRIKNESRLSKPLNNYLSDITGEWRNVNINTLKKLLSKMEALDDVESKKKFTRTSLMKVEVVPSLYQVHAWAWLHGKVDDKDDMNRERNLYKYWFISKSKAWKRFKEGDRIYPNLSSEIFNDFMKDMFKDDGETMNLITNVLSILEYIEITDKSPALDDEAMAAKHNHFRYKRLHESSQKYLASRFITYEMNEDPDNIDTIIKATAQTDYIEHHRIPNSCMASLIIDTYKDSFDKYHEKFCKKKEQLTYEFIYKLCFGKEYEGGAIGMSVEDCRPFFEKYRLGLEIFNHRNKIITSIRPESYNTHIKPQILRVMYKDSHVYHINGMESFIRKEIYDLSPPSEKYSLPKSEHNTMHHTAGSIEEIIDVMANLEDNEYENNTVNIMYTSNINKLVKYLHENGFHPEVMTLSRVRVSNVRFINLKKGDITYNINVMVPFTHDGANEEENNVSIEYYNKYRIEVGKFQTSIINKNNMTDYNDAIKEAMEWFPIGVVCGKCQDLDMNGMKLMNIDFKKHYTACLLEAPYLPVISYFEQPKPYDGHSIKDDCMYMITLEEFDHVFTARQYTHTRMFGHNLKKLKLKYSIDSYINLIKRPNNMKEAIDKVYASDLTEQHKKDIVNITIGILGKKENARRRTDIFKDKDDAFMYYRENGGGLYENDGMYYVNRVLKTKLNQGFLPIHEMVLDNARMKMYEMTNILIKDGFKIYGFKTDSVFVNMPTKSLHKYKVFHLKHKNNQIGGFRFEYDNVCVNYEPRSTTNLPYWKNGVPDWNYEFDMNPNYVKIKDEYNDEEINGKINNKSILIGKAGCGKTWNAIKYALGKYNKDEILVVTPWNAQAINVIVSYGVNAITFHMLKGMNLTETERKEYNVTGIKVIIFDEIMLHTHKNLIKMYKYMQSKPDITFIATGDARQLEAIGDVIDNNLKLRYIIQMFSNVINLMENKRIKKEHKVKMQAIENDIEKGTAINDIILKYFSNQMVGLNDVQEKDIQRGVTYFNSSQQYMNRSVHKYVPHVGNSRFLPNGIKLYVGESLICKKPVVSLQVGKATKTSRKMHVNNTYMIEKFCKDNMVLKNGLTGDMHVITYDTAWKCFILPYFNTVHASQGAKISENFVICDWQTRHATASSNWFYTAITRAVDLDHIHFLEDSLYASVVNIENKIEGYKKQDKLKGRAWGDDYIDEDWVMREYRKCPCCKGCGAHLSFEAGDRNVITVDRIDNNLAHIKNNCQLLCYVCNCAKK